MKRLIYCVAVLTLTVVILVGQDSEKKAAPKSGGATLHPEMTVGPDAGSFEKPMGTLGDKASETWTKTTVDAGVDKKPQPGKPITATGEIIDLSCYFQLGKHGEKHKSCGTKCITANQPIGLLTKNGTVYMLMEEEHDPRRDGQTALRQAAIDHFAHIMEVSGTEASHGGFKAIYVQGFAKK
jgi:hypothetical protein